MVRLVSPIALAVALAFALPACGAGSDAATSPALETSTTPPSSSPAPSTTAPATTLHVTWEQHAPPITIATPFCDAAGACLFPYRQDAIATGDVEGKATSAGDAAAPPSGKPNTYASIMTSVFTGRFASCGSGTAIIRRVESVDPETGAWSGHWQLVRGFGTGGLTALTGSGDIELPTPTSSADLPSRFVGDVSCNGDRDATAPVAARDGDASTITFHSATDIPALAPTVCDADNSCVWPTTLRESMTGDLQGTSVQAGVGRLSTDPAAPGYAATALDIFRGTVTGCGEGTLVLRSTSMLAGTVLTQQWEVVEGYGSGALSAVRGSGTGTATRKSDGTYGGGTGTGTISCG